jgi:hypothetical protein
MSELSKAAEQAITTLMASTKYVEGCANAPMVACWREHFDEMDKAINALRAALAEPEQSEPVMWAWQRDDGSWYDASATEHSAGMKPLIDTPPRREPLTEAQALSLWRTSEFRGNGGQADWFAEGIRAAEKHHGITGEKTKPLSDAEVTEAACSIDAALRVHLKGTGEKT